MDAGWPGSWVPPADAPSVPRVFTSVERRSVGRARTFPDFPVRRLPGRKPTARPPDTGPRSRSRGLPSPELTTRIVVVRATPPKRPPREAEPSVRNSDPAGCDHPHRFAGEPLHPAEVITPMPGRRPGPVKLPPSAGDLGARCASSRTRHQEMLLVDAQGDGGTRNNEH